MRKTIICGIVAACILFASPAWACPYCESDVGKEVAAGIFNENFAMNAALTLLPIPILLLIVYLIHFGIPWSKNASPASNSDTAQPTATLLSEKSEQ